MKKPPSKSKKPSPSRERADLRARAEALLKKQTGLLEDLSASDMKTLIHELGTHQIELEMQNEELRRAQEELEASRKKYADLYDFAPVGYVTLDGQGMIRDANLAIAQLLGKTRRSLLNKPLRDFVDGLDRNALDLHLAAVLESRQKNILEIRLRRGDRTGPFPALLESIADEDDEGKTITVRTAISDITERKRAEKRLAYLASFAQLNPNPVLETDMAGEVTFANPAAADTLERLGRNRSDTRAFVPDDLNGIIASWGRRSPMTANREVRIAGYVFAVTVFLTTDLNTTRLYAYDVTKRMKAEEALEQSMQRFELLSGTAGSLLLSNDPKTVVDSIYRKVMEQLKLDAFFNFLVDDAAGKLHLNAYAGIPPEEARRIEWLDFGVAVCGCAARDGRRIIAEHIPTTPDERTDLVRAYGIKAYACHPILGPAGKVLGTLSFGTRSRETFSEEDLSLMKAVTDQVSVAMIRMLDEQALRENEERLRLFIEHAPAALAMFDRNMRYVSVSRRWMRDYGLGDRDLRGLSHYEVFPEISGVWKKIHQRALAGEIMRAESDRFERADGSVQWLQWEVRPWHHAAGEIAGCVIFSEDITDRKRAEDELRHAAEEQDAIFRATPYLLSLHARDGRWLKTNPAAIDLFGIDPTRFDREELAKKLRARLLDGTPITPENMPSSRALRGEAVYGSEYMITDMQGKDHIIQINAMPLIRDGKVHGVVLAQTDITELRKTQNELKQMNEELEKRVTERTAELRNLQAHVEAVREAERTSIAREIHDELGQVLTAIKMDVSWLSKRLPREQSSLVDKAEDTLRIIDAAIQSVKRISAELRPGVLDDIGLPAAIDWACKEFGNRTGATCTVAISPENLTIDRMRSTALFRILQEALTNIVRHTKATRVAVSLQREGGDNAIILTVKDNGKGIRPEEVSSPHAFGLIGMRERVQFLHGKITFDGSPDSGTTVTVTLPIDSAREQAMPETAAREGTRHEPGGATSGEGVMER